MLQPKSPTYALLAVTEIARQSKNGKEGMQASELAETFDLPVAYLARILSLLVAGKILRSKRGPRGGFYLAQEAGDVSVLNVINAVGGVGDMRDSIAALTMPKPLQKGLSAVFRNAAQAARESLDSVTVDQLLSSGRNGRGSKGRAKK